MTLMCGLNRKIKMSSRTVPRVLSKIQITTAPQEIKTVFYGVVWICETMQTVFAR